MLDLRKVIVCGFLFSAPFLFQWTADEVKGQTTFHSAVERQQFAALLTDTLPGGYNGLFAGSGACKQCHGYDPDQIASVDLAGNDINVVDDWRATMMANSAKDPFWRAKVSHEVLLYPTHQTAIENKCTSCHAPLGHFAAFHNGATSYSMADLMTDTIGLDGVSCLACHQQSEISLGQGNSGHLVFDTAKVAYGPFISPLSSPMFNATGYEPVYSEHISDAGICAGCHTLITETLDYDGNTVDNDFVEQATYHEWLNSVYPAQQTTCQTCHLPKLSKGQFQLADGFDTEARDSFFLHDLVGANTQMLKLMRDNIDELGIIATPENFDEVIEKTEHLLQNSTLDLSLDFLQRTTDSVFLSVKLRNKAGHKFPSGYPARRAFVTLAVENATGDTLFMSGKTDANYELIGQNDDYEPHYSVIRSEAEVQIYELVMGDVNQEVTTVLLRAHSPIKDNRLPPLGFVTKHLTYDTVKVAGKALEDSNFNRDEGPEGSGTDVIFYHIPVSASVPLVVSAAVFYQSMPLKWMEEMFAENTPEIDAFRTQFEATDRTPFLMVNDTIHVAGINAVETPTPTPSFEAWGRGNGTLSVTLQKAGFLEIFDITGKRLYHQHLPEGNHDLTLPITNQIVLVRHHFNNFFFSKKIFLYDK